MPVDMDLLLSYTAELEQHNEELKTVIAGGHSVVINITECASSATSATADTTSNPPWMAEISAQVVEMSKLTALVSTLAATKSKNGGRRSGHQANTPYVPGGVAAHIGTQRHHKGPPAGDNFTRDDSSGKTIHT